MTATRTPGMPAVDGGMLISTNPADGAEAGRVPVADAEAVASAVRRARDAAAWWAALGFDGRKARLLRWRALIAQRVEELAELTHAETGKPVADAHRRDRSPRSSTSTGLPATPSGCSARAGSAPGCCSPSTPATWSTSRTASSA